jgi:hypothetical protein
MPPYDAWSADGSVGGKVAGGRSWRVPRPFAPSHSVTISARTGWTVLPTLRWLVRVRQTTRTLVRRDQVSAGTGGGTPPIFRRDC